MERQDFVVGGFTEPQGSRVGVESMLLGYYEGKALRFAGNVGTGVGWTDVFGRVLREQLTEFVVSRSPFSPLPPQSLSKNAHWLDPCLVADVQFSEWTGDGHIRNPSLNSFRADVSPTDIRREREGDRD